MTAGNKKDGLTDAGVNAIKAIGKDTGTGGKFSTFVAGNPEHTTEQFTATNLAKYRAVIFLDTAGDAPCSTPSRRPRSRAYFHDGGGFLGIGSGDRDRARLAVPDRHPRHARHGPAADRPQSATIKVADRVHDASKALPEYWDRTATPGTTSRPTSAASRTCSRPSSRIRSARSRRARCSTGSPAARWAPTIRSPGARTTRAAARSTPALGDTAASFDDANFTTHLDGAIALGGRRQPTRSTATAARPCSRTTSRSRSAAPPNLSEPIGFDQLPGRPGHPDRPPRRRAPARPGDRHDQVIADFAARPAADAAHLHATEDGLYGPAVDNNFATNKWVYLYYSPPTVTDVKLSDGVEVDRRQTHARPTNAPNTAASTDARGIRTSATSSSRASSSSTTPRRRRRTSTSAPSSRSCASPNNRGACCHVAGDIDFDTHNNLWMVTGDDTPAGGGNSGGFGPFNDQLTTRSRRSRVTERDRRHVHADLQRPDDRADRRSTPTDAADRRGARGALATSAPTTSRSPAAPVNTANVNVFCPARAAADRPAAADRRRRRR